MSDHATKPGRYFVIAFFLIFAVLVADQVSKWYVVESMLRTKSTGPDFGTWFITSSPIQFFIDQMEEYKTVKINDWLNFQMVWNRGMSFGMLDTDNPKMPLLFMSVSMLISVGMFVWMALARGRLLLFALPLIIGGAMGNVCDRVRFGAVADFIDVHIKEHHWPAFNLADSAICTGAVLLGLYALLDHKSGTPEEKKT